jgi:hypothetical protein
MEIGGLLFFGPFGMAAPNINPSFDLLLVGYLGRI